MFARRGVRARGKDLAVVPIAAIFGANASGKTNVLTAMRWMAQAVTDSVTEWSRHPGVPHRPVFALDPEARDEASLFEVDVVLAGVRYVYGFEVSDLRVESEWLHAYPAGRKQVWFERDVDAREIYRFPSEWLKGNRQDLTQATAGTPCS
jgi:predicted ATPase